MEESNEEEPIAKVASYQHPHHPIRKQSSRKGCGQQQTHYGPTWN